jgi:hypothetical protein
MNRRLRILLALLALSWLVVLAVLYFELDVPGTQVPSLIFMGLVLVAVALALLSGKSLRSSGLDAKRRWLKYFFGSVALVFAIWVLASLVATPFAGYAGFNLLHKPWFSLGTLLLALILLPVTRAFHALRLRSNKRLERP